MTTRTLVALIALLTFSIAAHGQLHRHVSVQRTNERLCGRVEDFTHNHGRDNRICSRILGQKRDLYVYLPPGYTPTRAYPLLVWLHGASTDEHAFLDIGELEFLDCQIRRGRVPPLIVACYDASHTGRNTIFNGYSFFLNDCAGRFEDYLLDEVMPFLASRYAVRPERQAHALLGTSGGGFAALSLAIRHPDVFGVVVSLAGTVNLRYTTCTGDPLADFSPNTYRWKTHYDPRERASSLPGGRVLWPLGNVLGPAFGCCPDVMKCVARANPADLIAQGALPPGVLAIRLSFGKLDHLNADAQNESVIWLAGQKGIAVTVDCDPNRGHEMEFFRTAGRRAYLWLAAHLLPPTE